MPFTGKAAYDEHVEEYPSKYPCVLEFEDYSSNDGGYAFHIKIIESMSGFVYENGNLYKLDTSDFICKNGFLYKKC